MNFLSLRCLLNSLFLLSVSYLVNWCLNKNTCHLDWQLLWITYLRRPFRPLFRYCSWELWRAVSFLYQVIFLSFKAHKSFRCKRHKLIFWEICGLCISNTVKLMEVGLCKCLWAYSFGAGCGSPPVVRYSKINFICNFTCNGLKSSSEIHFYVFLTEQERPVIKPDESETPYTVLL